MNVPSFVAELMESLERAGYAAYAVGGAVRDALRNQEPSDWDLATSALPRETLAIFSHLPTIPTGLAHGTVTVISRGHPVEITTFRSDGEYGDHRHPLRVCFGCDLEEDLARRDFTVNAIAYSPLRGFSDPFGGREDIEAGILRAVGEPRKRFDEDALRVMRALRFSSVLGYAVEEATSRAVRDMMEQMRSVSVERIWKEWQQLLGGKDALRVLKEYPELLCFLFPSLWREGEEVWGLSHWDRETPRELRQALCLCKPSLSPEENLELARRECKRFRCSNEQRKAVEDLLHYGRDFPSDETERKLLWAQDPQRFSLCARLHCLLCGEDPNRLRAWEQLRREKNECLTLAQLCLKGQDLTALGYRGREIAQGLQRLLYAAASGRVPNERQALLSLAEKEKPSPEGRA